MTITTPDLTGKIGEQVRVRLRPRLDVIGEGTFQFSEGSVRNIVEVAAATNVEWRVVSVTFPILEGVKGVEIVYERVQLLQQANTGLTILISALAGALAFAFVVIEVESLVSEAPAAVGASFAGVLILVVGAAILLPRIVRL